MNDTSAVLISAARTAVTRSKKGAFRFMRPEALGAAVVRAAIARAGIPDDRIDDILLGCAFPEGPQGMNLARIVAQKAGLPDAVPGAVVNRFCSSGLQSIAMASAAIDAGHADVVVAGGVESMSLVPMSGFYFQPDPELADIDPEVYVSMGVTAENVSEAYGIGRQAQDAFALESHRRAVAAIAAGRFGAEIVPVDVTEATVEDGRRRVERTVTVDTDEGPRADTSMAALAKLRAVFRQGGTVTAGNASQTSDGAAAVVVARADVARELGAEPLARIKSFALAGVAPEVMGMGPVEAIQKAIARAGLTTADMGLVELNEAFAAQALAVMQETGLSADVVNVNGGAIALGHPLGATGAKLTASLLYEMQRRGTRYGLVSMCVGGGMGAAAVVENLRV